MTILAAISTLTSDVTLHQIAMRAAGFWLAEAITWIVLIWLWTRRRRKPRIWR